MRQARVRLEVYDNSREKITPFDIEQAPFNQTSIVNHLLKQRQLLMPFLKFDEYGFDVPERVESSGITNAWFIALDCFGVMQFPVTILFASIAVENVMNHDSRLHDYRQSQDYKWIDLTEGNLRMAVQQGLPVSALYDENQTAREFVFRRNKIAHGDLIGYRSFYEEKYQTSKSMEDMLEVFDITERQALDQLGKSFDFIRMWAEDGPTIILDE